MWRRHRRAAPVYQVTDRLRAGRSVQVSGDQIAATVSAWLTELGTDSPLVADLVRAVQAEDWAEAHAIGEQLSVQVTSMAG